MGLIMNKEEILTVLTNKWQEWTDEKLEEFYGNRPPPNKEMAKWRWGWETTSDGIFLLYKNCRINQKIIFERNDGMIYTLRPKINENYWNVIRQIYVDSKLNNNYNINVEIPISCEAIDMYVDNRVQTWEYMITSAPNDTVGRSGHSDFLDPTNLQNENFLFELIDEIAHYAKLFLDATTKYDVGMPESVFCSENRWVNNSGVYWRHATGNLGSDFDTSYNRAKAFGISVLKLLYIPNYNGSRKAIGLPPLSETQVTDIINGAKEKWKI